MNVARNVMIYSVYSHDLVSKYHDSISKIREFLVKVGNDINYDFIHYLHIIQCK